MKKLLCTLFALFLLLALPITAHARDFTPEEGANTLYTLGLFQGTGTKANGLPDYHLNGTPTRAQAVTMLVRLLGKEAEAKAGTWDLPFTDLEDWARPYVGYAYTNGLTNGLSETRFGGSAAVTRAQYLTFLLRALGYSSETDFAWNNAASYAASLGLAAQEPAGQKSFTRGSVAALSAAALAQPVKDSATTLADQLIAAGTIDRAKAAAFGLTLQPDKSGYLNLAGSSYTLQNGAGRYLSASGGSLRLSDSPFVWYACVAGKDAFSLRPDSDRTQAIDVSNAYFEAGNPVSIFESDGHTAQHWRLWSVGGGRWLIVSAEDPELALCASGSGFILQKRSQASASDYYQPVFQKSDRTRYLEVTGQSGTVVMRAETRLLDLISLPRMQTWVNNLETAYADYIELTGWQPFPTVYFNMTEPEPNWGFASNSDCLTIDRDSIYEDVRDHLSKRKNDWNFGLLHEMSHIFDYNKPWDFHAEVVCDYKLAYVLVKNNATAIPADWEGSKETYSGWDILDVYQREGPLSQSLSVFSLAGKLAAITKQTGWDAAKQMFRSYPASIPASQRAQLELFIDQLGKAGGIDARAQFTPAEWTNAMTIDKL